MNRRGFFGRLAAAVVAARQGLTTTPKPKRMLIDVPVDPLLIDISRGYVADQVFPELANVPYVVIALEPAYRPGQTIAVQMGSITAYVQSGDAIQVGDILRCQGNGRVVPATTQRRTE